MDQGQLEGVPHGAVDEEVGGGVDNEEPVVEAGQAQVPGGGGEGVGAPEHLLHHEELGTVEDDPGDVAEQEHHHNADEDRGQVHLTAPTLVCLHMGESKKIQTIVI